MKYLKLKNKIKKLEDEKNNLTRSKFKLGRENGRLKEKIERLEKLNKDLIQEKAFLNLELDKKLKEPPVINISMNKESIDNIVKKVTESIIRKQEHKCTPECFGKHVIKAIQSDFDSHGRKFRERFIRWWFFNLEKEYPWLESLYIINEKIYFKSKESSI